MNQQEKLRKLKIFTNKKLRKIEQELHSEKKDWITVKEVIEEFKISRKSFDRMREKGLKVSQPKRNGKILINRNELETFLNLKQ